ncbi:hypothetical protein BDZ89DRAFT_1042324 [Hymenopellis radicata]|nr:hypothetical protein BDZ89DRAFT_1042324 [Hymenopellis radicata]
MSKCFPGLQAEGSSSGVKGASCQHIAPIHRAHMRVPEIFTACWLLNAVQMLGIEVVEDVRFNHSGKTEKSEPENPGDMRFRKRKDVSTMAAKYKKWPGRKKTNQGTFLSSAWVKPRGCVGEYEEECGGGVRVFSRRGRRQSHLGEKAFRCIAGVKSPQKQRMKEGSCHW